MVDLDQEVVDLCQEYLPQWHQGAFNDPRTTLLHEDARVYLDRGEQTFDVIILDLSEPVDDGPSYLLFTQEFYRLCRSHLNPGGVIVTQSGCTSLGASAPFHSVTITMESVFERVLPFTAFIPSFGSQWGFTLASTGALPTEHHPDELRLRLEPLEDHLRFVTADHLPCLFNLPKYQREAKKRMGRIIRDGEPLVVE
jgi:spermidine synthase